MSMSHEMVKAYVKNQLAKAVSGGIVKGTTELANGHTHKFAVLYDEHNKMFVGETSFDGRGPHTHYIMMGFQDVVETHLNNDPQPRDEDAINAVVPMANLPENMRRIIDFYNLKAIRMETHPAHPDNHTHVLVVRFAGHDVDHMGRKVEAKLDFEKGEQYGEQMEKAKKNRAEAEAELSAVLTKAIRPSVVEQEGAKKPTGPDTAQMPAEEVAKPADTSTMPTDTPDVEIEAEVELKDEAGDVSSPQASRDIDGAVDGTPKTVAEKMVEDIRRKAMSAEEELMARLKEHMKARKEAKTKYE